MRSGKVSVSASEHVVHGSRTTALKISHRAEMLIMEKQLLWKLKSVIKLSIVLETSIYHRIIFKGTDQIK